MAYLNNVKYISEINGEYFENFISNNTIFLPVNIYKSEIFVSIASYRDTQCAPTINDLFSKAKNPNRITVGVVQQNNATDRDLLLDVKVDHSRIKIHRMDAANASGPCLARYLASKLYRNEQFYLQIDSHMRFEKFWDKKILKIYDFYQKKFNTEKIILSHYPLEYKVDTNEFYPNHKNLTTVHDKTFRNDDGIIQYTCAVVERFDANTVYYREPIIAGGLLFGPGKMIHDVALDPDLPYLFHGEELLYSVRLFAKKYIILAPYKSLIFHYYERSDQPKIWDNNNVFYEKNKQIVERVSAVLLLKGTFREKLLTYTPNPIDTIAFYKYFNLLNLIK